MKDRLWLLRWKYRLYTGAAKTNVRNLLYDFTVFFIVLTFLLYLAVMYDNEINEYREFGFDYLILDLDEENISQLKEREDIDGLYPARLVRTEAAVRHNSESEKDAETGSLDLYLTDTWDTEDLSFWGRSREIVGEKRELSAESLILDILTARQMGVHPGDEILLTIGNRQVIRRVDRLVKPEFCLNDNIAVCLYGGEIRQIWEEQLPNALPEYSVLFLRGTSQPSAEKEPSAKKEPSEDQEPSMNKELDRFLYEEYAGPIGRSFSDEEREIYNRSAIVKKEWFREDSLSELQFTPPAAVAVCILGILLLLIFIWRENRKKLLTLRTELETLQSMGMPEEVLMCRFFILQSAEMTMTGAVAALTAKILLYDAASASYYLTIEMMLAVTGLVIAAGILLSAAAAIKPPVAFLNSDCRGIRKKFCQLQEAKDFEKQKKI